MKKAGLLALSIAGLFLNTACSSDDDDGKQPQPVDTQPPVITLESPENDSEFHPGEAIHIEGIITDNTALSEMRIEIHWAGDGHGHGKTQGEKWDYTETWEISGKEHHFHEHVTVPEDAEHGEHHLMVYALDAAGNQADFAGIDIIIEDEDHDGE